MLRQVLLGMFLLVFTDMLSAHRPLNGGEEDGKSSSAAEKAARDALVKFDKNWKDYTNEPNYGDPRWKLKMETLVGLAKAGPAALPLLEAAAKEGSPWAPHSRQLAAEVLKFVRDNPAVPKAWATYDLSQMDSAKVGKQAPDFALADASGQTYRLSQFRGKKTVVLTFILQDI
jgi:hypothetical protein